MGKFENIFMYSEPCFPVQSFPLSFDLSFDKKLIQGAKGQQKTILFLRGENLSRVSVMQLVKS